MSEFNLNCLQFATENTFLLKNSLSLHAIIDFPNLSDSESFGILNASLTSEFKSELFLICNSTKLAQQVLATISKSTFLFESIFCILTKPDFISETTMPMFTK